MTPEEREAFNEDVGRRSSTTAAGSARRGPTEYGGKGLSLMQGVVLAEEFARAKAPLRADFFGDTLVGPDDPAVGERGAEEGVPAADHAGQDPLVPGLQRARLGLRPGVAQDEAVLDGDEWVINGQKVWTTQAQFADYCFLLARTDPTRRSTRASPTCSCR